MVQKFGQQKSPVEVGIVDPIIYRVYAYLSSGDRQISLGKETGNSDQHQMYQHSWFDPLCLLLWGSTIFSSQRTSRVW